MPDIIEAKINLTNNSIACIFCGSTIGAHVTYEDGEWEVTCSTCHRPSYYISGGSSGPRTTAEAWELANNYKHINSWIEARKAEAENRAKMFSDALENARNEHFRQQYEAEFKKWMEGNSFRFNGELVVCRRQEGEPDSFIMFNPEGSLVVVGSNPEKVVALWKRRADERARRIFSSIHMLGEPEENVFGDELVLRERGFQIPSWARRPRIVIAMAIEGLVEIVDIEDRNVGGYVRTD